MTITPLQSLFQSWRKLLHDFQALGVLSCYSTLASLRNSFCGIDVGEGLWLGNCTAFIFTEDCRTGNELIFLAQQQHGRMNPLQWLRRPSKSVFPWAQCTYWKKWLSIAHLFFLLAIFNLFCTSWTIWVCVYSTFLFTDVFISIFLFCNERPLAMSILKHAKRYLPLRSISRGKVWYWFQ